MIQNKGWFKKGQKKPMGAGGFKKGHPVYHAFKKGNIPISPFKKGHKMNVGKSNPMFGKKGELCPAWKGGITLQHKVIRSSSEYKIWREAVFERDNWTCVWCGARSEKGKSVILNADHIKPFALFPELRFAIDNGRTLCIDCHKTTENYAKNNLIDWPRNKLGQFI